jgi:DNA invertase Pin-like site-specific DNA recombinase
VDRWQTPTCPHALRKLAPATSPIFSRHLQDQSPAALWLRVSTDDQHRENQLPDLERFAGHHGYPVVTRYELDESAWNEGSRVYRETLARALDDAHRGCFQVLVVWALDRLTRADIEGTLRLLRRFRERGVTVVSVQESWLNGSPEIQELLVAISAWVAKKESDRRSERVRAGLARRRDEGKPLGRQVGATDRKPRKRSGYVARWESETERARQSERMRMVRAGR